VTIHSDPIVRRIHASAIAKVPAVLWGPPGSGKTARVLAYALARKLHHERWLLSRCEPIDVKPRVYHEGDVFVREPPEIKRLRAANGGLLFLDEFNRSARETEGAALDIIDAPPPDVWVVAACNPPSRGQAARSLESAAANRFIHLDVVSDAKAWADAQVGGWPEGDGDLTIPDAKELAKGDATARALTSAYIRRAPQVLESTPDNTVDAGKAWASASTWEYARRIHGVSLALKLDAEDLVALLSGCVGAGNATTYLAYVEDCDLPDPEELIRNPTKYVPPAGRVDKTVAALTALAGAIESNFTDTRWKAAWGIIDRVVQADQADAAMVYGDLLIDAYKRFGKKDSKAQQELTKPQTLMPERMARILVGK